MNAAFDLRRTGERRSRARGGRGSPIAVLAVVLAMLGVFGTGGYYIWDSNQKPVVKGPSGPPPGYVAVPISAVQIEEYSMVMRDHLWDQTRGKLKFINLPKKDLGPDVKTSVSEVIGRVLKRRKSKGYIFTERDFFPKGTRPGIVAGIPPGRRALRLEASQISGVAGLVSGDVFDMVATIPVKPSSAKNLPVGGHLQGQVQIQAEMSNWTKQATVRVVVREGLVVAAMAIREVPTSSKTFNRSRQRSTIPVQEVVLAVKPEEVGPVTEALAVGATLMVVPYSGLPDNVESKVPNHQPWTPFGGGSGSGQFGRVGSLDVVETINGDKRQMTAVPKR